MENRRMAECCENCRFSGIILPVDSVREYYCLQDGSKLVVNKITGSSNHSFEWENAHRVDAGEVCDNFEVKEKKNEN